MKSKELREKRAPLATRIKELSDKAQEVDNETWESEYRTNWEQLNKDYDDLSKKIEMSERAEKLEAEQAAVQATLEPKKTEKRNENTQFNLIEDRDKAIQAWVLRQEKLEVPEDLLGAAKRVGVNLAANEIDIPRMDQLELRTDYTATPTTKGGDVIPRGFVPQFESALLAYGSVRRAASIMRTDTGNNMRWPTANDTSSAGELLAEAYDSDQTGYTAGEITTSYVELDSFKLSSKCVRITAELLRDSAFNMVSWLGNALGTRLGRCENGYFTTGTGSGQPQGIVTGSHAGKTCAATTSFTADEIIDFIHGLDPAYRVGAKFMMHDNVVLALRKLRDGEGRSMWQSGMTAGQPDMLYGYPIVVNQSMASSVTTSAKVMLFGDLSKYIIRDVGNVRLRRLVELYAAVDQEGFVAFKSVDGVLLDAGTYPIDIMTMAAG